MNVFELFALLKLNTSAYSEGLKKAESEGESASGKIGNNFKSIATTATTALTTATAAAAGAIATMTKSSITAFAEYEQLVGGVETLFGESADTVLKYADQAFLTAGVSANEYMETVTSFSASLLQSLNGDTELAAKYADQALTDMSDNANKMGSSMESIQTAYSGFAKQNYTMLDNLKLGYGGTKTEMERLITDAEALNESFTASRDANGDLTMSYADIVDAIHIVQDNMGITGTTALEASTTISGSVSSMKSAWTNFVTGLGNNNKDISKLMKDLSSTVTTALGNIEPVVETVFDNITEILPEFVTTAVDMLGNLIENTLPSLLDSAVNLVQGLIGQLPSLAQKIGNALPSVVNQLLKQLPSLLQSLPEVLGQVVSNLLPSLVETLGNILGDLPNLVWSVLKGVWNGVKSITSTIADMFVPNDDETLADTLYSKASKMEQTFTDFKNRLVLSWANIVGNEELKATYNAIIECNENSKDIIEKWNTLQTNLKEYSFENVTKQIQVAVTTATTYKGLINKWLNSDGTVKENAPLDTIISWVNEINANLGENVATITASIDASLTAGWEEGMSPDEQKAILVKNLESAFYPDGISNSGSLGEMATIVVDLTSEVLSKYTEEDWTTDKTKIHDDIQAILTANGVPEVIANATADAVIEKGSITDWTGSPNADFYQATEDWIGETLGFTKNEDGTWDSGIDIEAVADAMLKVVNDEMSITDFEAKLESLGIGDTMKDQIISYTVEYDEALWDKAIENLEKTMYYNALNERAELNLKFVVNDDGGYQNALDSFNSYVEQTGYNIGVLEGNYNLLNTAYSTNRAAAEDWALDFQRMAAIQAGAGEPVDIMRMSIEELDAIMPNAKADWEGMVNSMVDAESYTTAMNTTYEQLKNNIKDSSTTEFKMLKEMVDSGAISFGQYEEAISSCTMSSDFFNRAVEDMRDGVKDVSFDEWETFAGYLGMTAEELDAFVAAYLASEAEVEGNPIEGEVEITENSAEVLEEVGTNLAQTEEKISHAKGRAKKDKIEVDHNTDETASSIEANMIRAAEAINGLDTSTGQTELENFEAKANESTDNADVMGTNTAEGMNEVITEIQSKIEAVGTAFDGIRLKAVDTLGTDSALMTYLGLVGGRIINKITNGVNDNLSTFSSAIGSFASIIYNQAGDMYSAGLNIGYYAGQGLANGLYSMWNYVYSAASSLAQAAKSGATITLRVQSPSKVFTEIGEFVGEGLAIGISNMNDTVASASADLSDIVTSNMNPTIGYNVENTSENTRLESKLDDVVSAIRGMGISIDGRTLVGEIIEDVDSELGRLNSRVQRGGYAYV